MPCSDGRTLRRNPDFIKDMTDLRFEMFLYSLSAEGMIDEVLRILHKYGVIWGDR